MDLNNLVPSLELCRKIPTGVFEDSYAWYCWSYIDQKYLLCVGGKPDVRLFRDPCPCGMKYFYPAPTLQEILLDLPDWSDLTVDFVNPQISLRIKGKDMKLNPSPAAEALKIWLALKKEQGK
jgi:hypothetical protein